MTGVRGGVLFPDRETKTAIKRKRYQVSFALEVGVSKNNTVREREKGPGILYEHKHGTTVYVYRVLRSAAAAAINPRR